MGEFGLQTYLNQQKEGKPKKGNHGPSFKKQPAANKEGEDGKGEGGGSMFKDLLNETILVSESEKNWA